MWCPLGDGRRIFRIERSGFWRVDPLEDGPGGDGLRGDLAGLCTGQPVTCVAGCVSAYAGRSLVVLLKGDSAVAISFDESGGDAGPAPETFAWSLASPRGMPPSSAELKPLDILLFPSEARTPASPRVAHRGEVVIPICFRACERYASGSVRASRHVCCADLSISEAGLAAVDICYRVDAAALPCGPRFALAPVAARPRATALALFDGHFLILDCDGAHGPHRLPAGAPRGILAAAYEPMRIGRTAAQGTLVLWTSEGAAAGVDLRMHLGGGGGGGGGGGPRSDFVGAFRPLAAATLSATARDRVRLSYEAADHAASRVSLSTCAALCSRGAAPAPPAAEEVLCAVDGPADAILWLSHLPTSEAAEVAGTATPIEPDGAPLQRLVLSRIGAQVDELRSGDTGLGLDYRMLLAAPEPLVLLTRRPVGALDAAATLALAVAAAGSAAPTSIAGLRSDRETLGAFALGAGAIAQVTPQGIHRCGSTGAQQPVATFAPTALHCVSTSLVHQGARCIATAHAGGLARLCALESGAEIAAWQSSSEISAVDATTLTTGTTATDAGTVLVALARWHKPIAVAATFARDKALGTLPLPSGGACPPVVRQLFVRSPSPASAERRGVCALLAGTDSGAVIAYEFTATAELGFAVVASRSFAVGSGATMLSWAAEGRCYVSAGDADALAIWDEAAPSTRVVGASGVGGRRFLSAVPAGMGGADGDVLWLERRGGDTQHLCFGTLESRGAGDPERPRNAIWSDDATLHAAGEVLFVAATQSAAEIVLVGRDADGYYVELEDFRARARGAGVAPRSCLRRLAPGVLPIAVATVASPVGGGTMVALATAEEDDPVLVRAAHSVEGLRMETTLSYASVEASRELVCRAERTVDGAAALLKGSGAALAIGADNAVAVHEWTAAAGGAPRLDCEARARTPGGGAVTAMAWAGERGGGGGGVTAMLVVAECLRSVTVYRYDRARRQLEEVAREVGCPRPTVAVAARWCAEAGSVHVYLCDAERQALLALALSADAAGGRGEAQRCDAAELLSLRGAAAHVRLSEDGAEALVLTREGALLRRALPVRDRGALPHRAAEPRAGRTIPLRWGRLVDS